MARTVLLTLAFVLMLTTAAVAEDEDRLADIQAGFAGVQSDYEAVKNGIGDLIRVKFEVRPQLILLGETVTVTITADSTTQPNSLIEIEEGIYRLNPTTSTHTLQWQGSADRYVARWCWTPERCGNYLVRWNCDIGGDISQFSRNVSVIDDSYAVLSLNVTSHISPRPEPDLHELHLPFSVWTETLLYAKRWTAESFAGVSRPTRQFGDNKSMFIFLSGDYTPSESGQPFSEMRAFYGETEAVQREVLLDYKKLWDMYGFRRPLEDFYCYGFGNMPITIARSLGYKNIGALCADQNWKDGSHEFNHWGMPARPYFVSEDDFRKTGDGGAGGMIGFQQCERQTNECRDYHCCYAFEGGISFVMDTFNGVSRERIVNEMAQSREKDFFQCFVESADQRDGPYFFCAGIEMNGVWPWMAACNRQFMEYLVQRARDVRIAYASPDAVADFYRRHYTQIPESVLYLVDVFAGLPYNEKPLNYYDTLEIENGTFRSIFRNHETLPYAYYAYTTTWDYPDWGNEDIPRDARGYIIPDTDDRFRVTPYILDTRKFDVTQNIVEESGGTRVDIHVIADVAQSDMAFCVWHLPRDYSKDPGLYELTGAKRFVPIRASFTGNLCGIVVADIAAGENDISVLVKTSSRSPRSADMQLTGDIRAKVLARDGTAVAYLYSIGSAGIVQLVLPAGVTAQLYPYDSDDPVELNGVVNIPITPGQCPRILGLTYDELLGYCPTASALAP